MNILHFVSSLKIHFGSFTCTCCGWQTKIKIKNSKNSEISIVKNNLFPENMAKHKKFLKSEKAKIKLKGAKLPKGLNVTKTDFKVKKIVIREQIKDSFHADGTVTRSENIKVIFKISK